MRDERFLLQEVIGCAQIFNHADAQFNPKEVSSGIGLLKKSQEAWVEQSRRDREKWKNISTPSYTSMDSEGTIKIELGEWFEFLHYRKSDIQKYWELRFSGTVEKIQEYYGASKIEIEGCFSTDFREEYTENNVTYHTPPRAYGEEALSVATYLGQFEERYKRMGKYLNEELESPVVLKFFIDNGNDKK